MSSEGSQQPGRRHGAKGRRVRTPTRLQMEAAECGAAALAIVLEYHGTYVPLSQLREQCGVSRDGSNAANVLKVARRYGMVAKGFRKEPAQLREMPMPVIAHWNFNHFLVVEGFGKKHVYLNDPASGPTVVSHDEFDHSFTGVVLTLQPNEDYAPHGRRPRMLPSLLRRVRHERGAFLFVALAGLGLVLPGLAVPLFGMVFVDQVLISGKVHWLPSLVLGMLLTAGLLAAFTALQRTYLLKLLTKLGVSMSSTFMWHALRLPVGFYLARSPGDLVQRVQDNDTVAHTLSGELSGVALDLLVAGFYAALMLYVDPWLTLVGFGTVGAQLGLLRAAKRLRTDISRQVSQQGGKLAGVAASGLQMIETIKATGAETEFFGQWAGYQAKLVTAQQRLARYEQLVVIGGSLISRLAQVLVLSLGALRIMDGHLTVGALVAFQGLVASFIRPVQNLAAVGASLQRLRGDLERLDDTLEHGQDGAFGRPERALDESPRRLTGELELRDVTFGYLPLAPPLIMGFSLHLAPGQRVALVGGTGSGKSTIAKLVCGLYEPWGGEVLFDGIARRALARQALVSSIAAVDQDVTLFEGTVRENITLWDETVPEAEVVQAAKDACIHEDIAMLPGGYDAKLIDGGANLSGGQRQRLELARALAKQPALVVLDEGTSALDPETERRVDENLRRRGCSCLIVAHRLSTIRDADEIIVLDRGEVAERGSHEELLEEGGLYRELIATSDA